MQGGERLCRGREDKQHTQQHGKKHLLLVAETLIRDGFWLGVQKGHGSLTFFSPSWEATVMFGVAFSVGMKGEADRSSTSAVSTDVSCAFSLLANPMEELSTCKQPAWTLPCQRERELQNLVQRQQSNSVTPHCMISVRQ